MNNWKVEMVSNKKYSWFWKSSKQNNFLKYFQSRIKFILRRFWNIKFFCPICAFKLNLMRTKHPNRLCDASIRDLLKEEFLRRLKKKSKMSSTQKNFKPMTSGSRGMCATAAMLHPLTILIKLPEARLPLKKCISCRNRIPFWDP